MCIRDRDNLAGAMLEDLGCVNIAARQPSLLEELTLEAIVVEDPDCIFISVMGGDEEAALAVVEETLGQNPCLLYTSVRHGGHLAGSPHHHSHRHLRHRL